MLYHKFSHDVHGEIKTELYEDEIVTYCPTCQKEIQVEPELIAEIINSGADFAGTNIYCNGCYKKFKVVK